MRRLLPLLAVLAAWLVPAAAAQADAIDDAVRALRQRPVYVDPQARAVLSAAGQQAVEREIAAKDPGPVYAAVFPAGAAQLAGGSARGVAQRLAEGLRARGTYAVIVGSSLEAGATGGVLDKGVAPKLASEVVKDDRGKGARLVLVDFVDRVAEARANGGSAPSSGGGGATGILGILALLAAGGGLFAFVRNRRARREEAAQVAELRDNVRDDLVALGDDVRAIDIPIEQRDADPRAKEALGVALERYEQAETALNRARRPEDFEPIGEALEDGRYQMEVAKARLEHREPPARRPPCFFDPRHGPSVRDVLWAPPDGEPRPVPACAADAVRLERGEDPEAREVLVGGRRTPYWEAPAYYGPYAGGFFGGLGGGLLPGVLLGTVLGGSLFGPGMAWGGGFGDGYGDFGGGDGDGGGLGGDFGGDMDFGGGDFGGGDFGGGDF